MKLFITNGMNSEHNLNKLKMVVVSMSVWLPVDVDVRVSPWVEGRSGTASFVAIGWSVWCLVRMRDGSWWGLCFVVGLQMNAEGD